MQIKPSASIRQNYNEIADLCRSTGEPVYLTKNGEGDLVVMDIEAFTRREKMLKLREELLAVEEDRLAGRAGVTPDELDSYLDSIIDEVEEPVFITKNGVGDMVVMSLEAYERQQGLIDLYVKLAEAEEEIANGAEGKDFFEYARQLRSQSSKS
ncbi:MAG: type II toxin-antitoxin system prevent-host-death family antitoxin [Syntrophomonas sp.]